MQKRILKLGCQNVKFVFQVRLSVSAHKFYRLLVAQRDRRLFLALLVLLEELCELLVVFEFLLFHGDDRTDVLFEMLQMTHDYLLLLHKIIDVSRILCQHSFFLVGRRNSYVFIVICQNVVCVSALEIF